MNAYLYCAMCVKQIVGQNTLLGHYRRRHPLIAELTKQLTEKYNHEHPSRS